MFNKVIFIFAVMLVAVASAAPHPEAKPEAKPLVVAAAPLAYTAPVVTATSSQAIVRNYNGLAVSAPLVAAAAVSPYAAYSAYSPFAYSAYSAYPSAYTTYPYVASPYTAAVVV